MPKKKYEIFLIFAFAAWEIIYGYFVVIETCVEKLNAINNNFLFNEFNEAVKKNRKSHNFAQPSVRESLTDFIEFYMDEKESNKSINRNLCISSLNVSPDCERSNGTALHTYTKPF